MGVLDAKMLSELTRVADAQERTAEAMESMAATLKGVNDIGLFVKFTRHIENALDDHAKTHNPHFGRQ